MRRVFTVFAFVLTLLLSINAYAAERLIEATGRYVMDSRLGETTAAATERAREDAKRAAAMKAGVYLESYSKTVNLELTEDEVQMVASRLLKIQDEKSDVKVVDGHLLQFNVTIKAIVDDVDESALKSIMTNKQNLSAMTKNYKELQAKYDALNRQMEEYRKGYDKTEDKALLKEKVRRNSEEFNAAVKAKEGLTHYYAGKIKEALASYDAAIKLNPRFAEAYNNRGVIYYSQNKFAEAVADYTLAVNFRAQYADAYYNRAIAYGAMKNYPMAKADLEAALRINPNDADAAELYRKLQNS